MGENDLKAIEPTLTFDAHDNILFVTHTRPTHLATRAQIQAYFDSAMQFWRRRCQGNRVYCVVAFDNLTIDARETEFYAEQIKRVLAEALVTVVRYGGSPLQRTVSRLVGMQLHIPSRIYGSREEAVTMVRALQRGEARVAPASE